MAGDARIKPFPGIGLQKGTFSTRPPPGFVYLIHDSDGVPKLFDSNGTKSTFASSTWYGTGEVYCCPAGSDSNSGLTPFAPKQTGYAGAVALQAIGGGRLVLEQGTSWGGPNGCAWIEGAGVNTPGFLQQAHGMTIEMLWRPGDSRVFNRNSCGALIVSSYQAGRKLPGIWVKSLSTRLMFKNILPVAALNGNVALDCPWRIGVEYDRKPDLSTLDITVTSATRAAGSTTFTVTLPQYTILQASRTANVVTARVAVDASQYINWRVGSIVHVTSTSGSFASGNYTVLSSLGLQVAAGLGYDIVTYAETAADVGTISNIGTWGSHGCGATDRVDIFSSSSEFPNSMYEVTGSTATTITVADSYGYAPRSASVTVASIGTLVRQQRLAGTSLTTLVNCDAEVTGYVGGLDTFQSGPAFDIGASNATPVLFDGCVIIGADPPGGTTNAHYHADRQAGILMDSGPGTTTGSSVVLDNCSGKNGAVRMRVRGGTDSIVAVNTLWDTSTGNSPPVLDVPEATLLTSVTFDNVDMADNALTVPIVRVRGTPDPNKFKFTRTGMSGNRVDSPGIVDGAPLGFWQDGSHPWPWVAGQTGNYGRGRIAGRHPGSNRAMGPLGPRFTNRVNVPSSWTLPGGASLSATDAPDGSNTGNRVSGGAGTLTVSAAATISSAAVGDRLAMGVWLRGAGCCSAFGFAPTSGATTVLTDGAALDITVDGWTWYVYSSVVTSLIGSSITVSGTLTIGTTCDIWGASCIYVPVSVGESDYREWLGTFKHQPQYLAAGMSGTMEGQKFCAHGGLATAKRYTVGAGSGQITIGAAAAQAIEVFDEAGNSLGVLRPNAFTVNP